MADIANLNEVNMNNSELRQKIETQLDKLTPERLELVSNFLDSIQTSKPKDSSSLRKLATINRRKKVTRW